jgi:hypothetical protein
MVCGALQEGQEQQAFLREGVEALEKLQKGLARWELQRLLGGEYDKGSAVLSIQVPSRTPPLWASPALCFLSPYIYLERMLRS